MRDLTNIRMTLLAPVEGGNICELESLMTFLGIVVFLKKLPRININLLPVVMEIFAKPHGFTLGHMILAEILRSL